MNDWHCSNDKNGHKYNYRNNINAPVYELLPLKFLLFLFESHRDFSLLFGSYALICSIGIETQHFINWVTFKYACTLEFYFHLILPHNFRIQPKEMRDDFGLGRIGLEAVGGENGAVVRRVRGTEIGRHRKRIV